MKCISERVHVCAEHLSVHSSKGIQPQARIHLGVQLWIWGFLNFRALSPSANVFPSYLFVCSMKVTEFVRVCGTKPLNRTLAAGYSKTCLLHVSEWDMDQTKRVLCGFNQTYVSPSGFNELFHPTEMGWNIVIDSSDWLENGWDFDTLDVLYYYTEMKWRKWRNWRKWRRVVHFYICSRLKAQNFLFCFTGVLCVCVCVSVCGWRVTSCYTLGFRSG